MADLVEYLKSKGHKLKAIGSIYRTRCPFPDHKETKPSFTIYPKTESFFCYGCRRSGTIITLMRLFRDPIPPALLEAERTRKNTDNIMIRTVQKDQVHKVQSILTRIRRLRPTYFNQVTLNNRMRAMIELVKGFHI